MHYLIVPGLNNSGPSHWQTFWTKSLPSASRVFQHCWDKPQKEDWIATLDDAVRQLKDPPSRLLPSAARPWKKSSKEGN